MSTLFVIQNDTHAKNFNVLAQQAISMRETVSILLLDGVTHEATERIFASELARWFLRVEVTAKPFYRSGSWSRVRICGRFKSWARESIGSFDHVVIGNDGALQKIIVKAVRAKNAHCRVTIMLDGLLTREKGVRGRMKRGVQRLAERLGIEEFVPSTVGLSRLVDDITVMHPSVADVLCFHGVPEENINVSPLPRHAAIRFTGQRVVSEKRRVLFLGSAFLWHGERTGHGKQAADFDAFGAFAGRSIQHECRLRIHPRDDISYYPHIDGTRLQLSTGSQSLESDLEWADIVLSSRSSGLFDATLAGRRAYVYTGNFSAPTEDSFLDSLPRISNFEEID